MKIQLRITLLVIFLTSGLGLILLFEEIKLVEKQFGDSQNRWIASMATIIADSIALGTIDRNKISVEQQIKKIVAQEKFLHYIYVRDFDGNLFADSFKNGFPLALIPHIYDEVSHIASKHSMGNALIKEISAPLIKNMDAKIFFGVNQNELVSILKAVKRDLILSVLIIVMIGMTIAILVGRQITLPLQVLSDKIQRFSTTGEIKAISVTTNEPHVKNLTKAFNEMVRVRTKTETSLFESEAKLRTTFESIGDAVLSTNTQGLITRMNPVAEELTGWTIDEAHNKPLNEIFIIINSKTRKSAVNPVITVLEKGKIVGLANHTILISKSKKEFQIADSAAPIKDDFGKITGVVLVFRDVTKEYAIREALVEREHELSLHMENTPIGVINWDKNLKCTAWNPAAEKIFGFSSQEALGRQAETLITTLGNIQGYTNIKSILQNTDENRQIIIDTQNKKGQQITCEWFNTQIFNDDGDCTQTASLVQDVSYRIEIENELRMALVDAEQANHAKSEFLATMSHEFRTPLNAILGFSEILESQYFGPLGAENYKEYAHDIHLSGQLMLELVNDVLDISAIEAGTRLPDKTAIDPATVISDCVHNISQMAKQKRIKLDFNTPKTMPRVKADKRSITQVVLNLLTNAIKFTDRNGEIMVEATHKANTLKIKVIDTGIGIAKNKIPVITDPFMQLESDPHLAQEGTGLGLSIVKSLVEMHGGRIKVKSKMGKGTEVTVTFKCKKSNETKEPLE